MSVFFCSSCDQLVDSDDYPDFTYDQMRDEWHDQNTKEWTCQTCNENEEFTQSPGIVDFNRTYSIPTLIRKKLGLMNDN